MMTILAWLDNKSFELMYRIFRKSFKNGFTAAIWWNKKTAKLFNEARWETGNYASLYWQ